MPEKHNGCSITTNSVELRTTRELTQTDKLNKRLLEACLQFINTENNRVPKDYFHIPKQDTDKIEPTEFDQ